MRDSQLRRPLTFLRQSHSFFRESCSIFCLSPSWAGGPLSAFFAHCCNLSCKLQEAEHHEKQNSFIYSVSLTLRRETTGGVKLICYQMSVLPCLQPSPPAARAVHHPLLVQQSLQCQNAAHCWSLPVHSGQQLHLLVFLGFQLQLLLPESSLDISKLCLQCQHCFLQGSSLQFRFLQLQQKGSKCNYRKVT